jgi:hypothetical protein
MRVTPGHRLARYDRTSRPACAGGDEATRRRRWSMKRSMTRWKLAGCTALAALVALGTVAVLDGAPATADAAPSVSSTVSDPVGDAPSKHDPAFQDIVRGEMTRTANGDFRLLMEMAAPVPAEPTLTRAGAKQIWWMWYFDDPATSPKGYPASPGFDGGREVLVYVSWDGTAFAGTAVDRRPLLVGGEASIVSVPFSVSGTVVEATLASTLFSAFPATFGWGPRTVDWTGPLGSAGFHPVDDAESTFNP